MYPPGWVPSILPPPDFTSHGVRLLSPDGTAAYEVYTTLLSSQVSARQMAETGIRALIGASAPATILCADEFALPMLNGSQAIVAVSSGNNVVVGTGIVFVSFESVGATYVALGGPGASLESLVRTVFIPVGASFPKGGAGGDNDRDDDGYDDDVDDYPDDPDRH